MEKHYMIDIETSGVDKKNDEILEVALVEIELVNGYWNLTGKQFHRVLHYPGQPKDSFAIKHMSELYLKCNLTDENEDYAKLSTDLPLFLHDGEDEGTPKFFMGWNASNFDIPFMFIKNILTPSYYIETEEGQELRGDVHYRIYEQTGALNFMLNMTGLSKKSLRALSNDLNPVYLDLPKGKSHDALYDCYSQINMMNGLIAIGRKGIRL